MVDAIDPVLDLHNNASIVFNNAGTTLEPLGRLESQQAHHHGAAVDLEGILVGEDVDLDAREVTRERGDGATGAPVVRSVLGAVDQPRVVVADAAEAAVALDLGGSEVCA